MKIISVLLIFSVFCYTSVQPRTIKPKDFDQRQSASSYAYRSDHTGPSGATALFVTGNGSPQYGGSGYQSFSGYNKPVEYETNYDTKNGAHSYVIKHVTGGQSNYPSSRSFSHHDTSPLHHRPSIGGGGSGPLTSTYDSDEPSAHIHSTSHESIESEAPIPYDVGVDSGSVEIEHQSGPAQYTHGTFHNYGGHGDNGQSFHKGYKDSYDQDYYKKHGDKGKKSYDKAHKEAKGNKGHYDHADAEGHHDEKGGHSNKHYDEGDKYASHNEEGYTKKGGKHGEKKHHKKGSKTTGYHNVYHKDEYKKDHKFYDESDHRGHFSKHGENEKKHSADAGYKKQGGYHDSAYDQGHSKKHGSEAAGHIDEQQKKYKKKQGYDKHYADHEKYGKKHGDTSHDAGGYEEHGHDY